MVIVTVIYLKTGASTVTQNLTLPIGAPNQLNLRPEPECKWFATTNEADKYAKQLQAEARNQA